MVPGACACPIAQRVGFAVSAALLLTFANATWAQDRSSSADALLAIDQNRGTVVERIVSQWGAPLEQSGAGLSSAQLRTMLQGLRADHLLAASLAGSLPGLRDVLANSLTNMSNATSTRVHIKAVGDVADDLVYTPVSPCRLFDSRPAQGGLGVLNPNVRRTYGATTPVTNQGGPGGCVAPAGAAVALIQIGTLTPAGNGYLQGGAQGIATFPNALILYQPGDQYGTSVAMPLNVANGRFDVQVQFAATDLYGDLLGYFKPAVNSSTGAFEVAVNGALALQIKPDATSPIVIAGSSANTVTAGASGAVIGGGGAPGTSVPGAFPCGATCANRVTDAFGTVGGGAGNLAGDATGTTIDNTFATVSGGISNTASGNYSTVGGGRNNTASSIYSTVGGGNGNTASGASSTVAGGFGNSASGIYSFAAGVEANADAYSCVVFSGWSSLSSTSCSGLANFMRVGFDHGLEIDYSSPTGTGGGTRYVYIGDVLANKTIAAWNGAFLSDAGVWVNASSSKASKTDFGAVDPSDVLRKVANLPITTWRYKEGEGAVRHIGPMAEDFDAAFGVGYGPHTIADLDARGVALAAIQGLNSKADEQMAIIREQQQQIAELMKQLQEMRDVFASHLMAASFSQSGR
jgi:Chaperone of endosialidase